MSKQSIDLGTTADDGTGTTLRDGGDIVNDNFNEVYTKLGDGSDLYDLTFPNATDTVVGRATSDTLTNKTIGVGQLTCATRAYTGDGSTTGFTVTNGQTVDNVLVFLNGVFQRPTTDYTVSGTTLTFGTAPIADDVITIKEL